MNGPVFAMAANQAGTVYAGGTFTTAGGTTVANIARWANGSWGTLLTGLGVTAGQGSQVTALAISPDGTLYVGGTFGLAGGTTTRNIAYWDGAAWGTVTNGVNGQVFGLDVAPSGTLYACGAFTQANGTTANYVAFWDKSNWGTMAGGQDAILYAIKAAQDGFIYTAGNFTTPASAAGSFGIARWNGQSWESIWSNRTTNTAYTARVLHFDQNNTLYAGGYLPVPLVSSFPRTILASWNGASWQYEITAHQVFNPGFAYGITSTNDNTLYVGGSFAVVIFGTPILVSNDGTAPAEPIIRIRGTGAAATLDRIVNWTTNQSIFFNLTVNNGETIYIDTRAGRVRMFSTWRGNVISSLLSGSELAGFVLAPGANYITAQTSGSSIAVDLYFRMRNWSADAV